MPRKIPSYRRHSTGQGTVRLNGKDHYLGVYGSPESKAAYERLIAEWLAGGRAAITPAKDGLTVAALLALYDPQAALEHAGNPARLSSIRSALAHVLRLYGPTPAQDFGPVALKAVRSSFVAAGWSRGYVNAQTRRVVNAFAWAVANELLGPEKVTAMREVPGLRKGKTEAHERPKVLAAPEADVNAVRLVVSPMVRDLIDLQLLTGARPGELLIMRPGDVERPKRNAAPNCDELRLPEVWTYRPFRHKTEHHGHERTIYLGPQAQAIVSRYLDRGEWCFPASGGMGHYTRDAYTLAIRRGCRKAKVPHWHPHRLRHSACTNLEREFGPRVAKEIMGHATARMTELYTDPDKGAAIEAMRKCG